MHPTLTEPPFTIAEARRALDGGEITAVELVERAAAGIAAHDEELGIFLAPTLDSATRTAAEADRRRADGAALGPLDGIPVVVKDIVFTSDAPTTGQSLARDPAPTGDAPALTGLRTGGAVFLGKTTTMEFALGFTDPAGPFPVPRNPWDALRWTGGSSSGTASAIALGIGLGGVGTDTAASIREPAAWCGITGHKPTHGLVPQEGVLPLAWSFDHVGPMARTAEDCALLLNLMARPGRPVASAQASPTTLRGLRVGVAVEPLERSQPEVQALVADAVAALTEAGAETRDVRLPHYDEANDVVMLGLASEGLAYHHGDARTRWTDYGPVARAALLAGLLITGADAVQLQRVRRHIQRRSAALYRDLDVIVAPTCGGPAPLADRLDFNEVVGLLHTQYWNATGEPALSVPIGTVKGLPVGLQIAGPAYADDRVLAVGHLYQQLTDHHLAHPLAQGATR